MQSMKNFLGKLQEKVDFSKRFGIIQIKIEVERDEQNRQKEQPTNKANGNQKSLGRLKGAKTVAR